MIVRYRYEPGQYYKVSLIVNSFVCFFVDLSKGNIMLLHVSFVSVMSILEP